MLAIIPLFTIALTIGYIDDAEARQVHNCGVNEQCNGPAPMLALKAVKNQPHLIVDDVISPIGFQSNEYMAVIKVYAGDSDVTNLQLLVKSDVDAEKIRVHASDKGSGGSSDSGTIWANTYSTATVKIFALNPGSIDGEILSWELLD